MPPRRRVFAACQPCDPRAPTSRDGAPGWQATLQFGAAMALVSGALVPFQWNSRQGKEFAKEHAPDEQKQAAGELFHGNREERTIGHDPNPFSTA